MFVFWHDAKKLIKKKKLFSWKTVKRRLVLVARYVWPLSKCSCLNRRSEDALDPMGVSCLTNTVRSWMGTTAIQMWKAKVSCQAITLWVLTCGFAVNVSSLPVGMYYFEVAKRETPGSHKISPALGSECALCGALMYMPHSSSSWCSVQYANENKSSPSPIMRIALTKTT